jgi:tetratricopeptide (TPR) repeat protein
VSESNLGQAPLPAGLIPRLETACDRFEAVLKAGERPRIEEFLEGMPEPGRPALLRELLVLDLEYRGRSGESPSATEYLARFASYGAVIDGVFAGRPVADAETETATLRSVRLSPSTEPGDRAARPPALPGSDPVERSRATDGRYEILSERGRGGMGSVHVCHDRGLGRDLAFKVLLPEHRERTELVRRFNEEARIGGQLQHPGIVPVHDLGTLPDRRPYFTMKLVKGRTLAGLLAARTATDGELPRLLGIFELICQTMAYVHAHRVVHRDLKPSNIMVGAFGEVQVMDWGLAKVLSGATDDGDRPRESVIPMVRTGSDTDASRAGSVLGTPAYMPPEQARGEVDRIDERSDVFSLGGILCEILTGAPPYRARSTAKAHAQAFRAELDDAFKRLDRCAADPELCELARRCLSVAREDRPRNAGEVAAAVTAHLQGVQERLRQSEVARCAAQARAEEEAKRRELADQLAHEARARADAERTRRRLAVGLMASVVVLVAVIGGGAMWLEMHHREQAAQLRVAVEKATWLTRAARDALEDPTRLAAAREAVGQIQAMTGDTRDDATRARIADLARSVVEISRDRATLETLAEIRSASLSDSDGAATEAGYSDALIATGIHVTAQSPDAVGAAIRARPPALARALTAALDDWAAILRDRYRPADEKAAGAIPPSTADARRALSDAFGGSRLLEPGERSRRQALEQLGWLEQGVALTQAAKLTAMAQAADPDPWRDTLRKVLGEMDPNTRRNALVRLARDEGTTGQAAVGLNLLARALFDLDDPAIAEDVLRAGLGHHPRDLWLNYDLGVVLLSSGRRREAIVYLTAARAIRPETAHELAHALDSVWERPNAAISVFEDLTRLRPDRPIHWLCLSKALRTRGRDAEALNVERNALKTAREALRANPGNADAHHVLGVLLSRFGLLPNSREARAHLLRARQLRPNDASISHDLHEVMLNSAALSGANLPDLGPLNGWTALDDLPPDLLEQPVPDRTPMAGPQRPLSELDAVRAAKKNLEAMASLVGPARGTNPRGMGILEALEIGQEFARALRRKSDHDIYGHRTRSGGGIAALQDEIRRRPDDAELHAELAAELTSAGQLEEAMDEFQRALDLEPPDSTLAVEVARRLGDVQRRVTLAERLPRVLRGDEQPDGADDWLELAAYASGRRLHAGATRLYEGAMAAEPELFDPLQSDHRYQAACAAALAGSGAGLDQPAPTVADRDRLRARAREWLGADLAVWSAAVAGHAPDERARALETLSRWKTAFELEGVRDAPYFSRLPPDEAKAWRALWSRVEALVGSADPRPQNP